MFRRKPKEEDPEATLARCIVLLDDIRAYRRKDTELIEGYFSQLKKSRFKEHYDMWIKARPSAERIVDMPMNISGVKKMIGTLAWLKVANRFSLVFLIFFIAIQLVPMWKDVLGPHPFGGNGFLYATIFVVLVVVSMNIATLLDYRIRKKIIAYENQTMDEYASARNKMKECVSKMMKSLAKEAKRSSKGLEYYGLVLYFDDYDNIEVVDKWRPKIMGIFKRSYSHYQVVPKLGSQ